MFKNYLKIAFRNLFRQKGYSTINLFGLAIGMACCFLILLYIQDEMSYDRYAGKSDQIYRIVLDIKSPERGELHVARTPPPWAPALKRDYPEIESFVRFKTPLVSWLVEYEKTQKVFHEKGFYFSDPTVFEFFNFYLLKGDPNTALIEPNTIVLTESMAIKYFGDEDPIGKTLRADNTYNFLITGVMQDVPKNSHFTFGFLASFESLNVLPIYGGAQYSTFQRNGLNPDIYTYLRFKEGISPQDFEKKFPAFLNKYLQAVIERLSLTITPHLQPLTSIHLHSNLEWEIQANSDIAYIYIFSAIGLFLILIACINFMNLATARSATRAQEVGMRKVVGAYRNQLMRQFLGESLFLTILALVLAIVLTSLILPLFNTMSGKYLTLSFNNVWVIPGMIGIVLLVGFLSGSYPAIFLSSFQPADVLKGSLKAGTTNSILRKALVFFQFAVSILFIIGTGIVYTQLNYIQNKRLGFIKERVIILPMGDPRTRQIYLSFKEQVVQDSRVTAVSGTSSVPGGLTPILLLRPEGTAEGDEITMETLFVDHDFLKTLGVEISQGRDFSLAYSTDVMEAFILNETAAAHLGWEEDPIGKRIILPNFKDGLVIGVVKDFHLKSLHSKIEPLMIQIAPNPDAFLNLAVKINSPNISATLKFLEQKWQQVYPNDPFIYSFLGEDYDNLYRSEKQRGRIFIAFSLLAVAIACLGLLGLSSFTAEQKTKEIGIRKVLGATVSNILGLLSREYIKLILLANIAAWPLAFFFMRNWLQNFAYRVNLQLWIFPIAGIIALFIALITVSYQSLRAALANPADSLRME